MDLRVFPIPIPPPTSQSEVSQKDKDYKLFFFHKESRKNIVDKLPCEHKYIIKMSQLNSVIFRNKIFHVQERKKQTVIIFRCAVLCAVCCAYTLSRV